MPLMPWFHLVLIEKVCHTKKPFAGSTRQVAVSLTLLSSSPSSPSRNQKCPLSSPPPARRFHQPCKRTSSVPRGKNLCYRICGAFTTQQSGVLGLDFLP